MGKRSNDRGKENQLFRLSYDAREVDLDLVRGSPYRPAAPKAPHQKASQKCALDPTPPKVRYFLHYGRQPQKRNGFAGLRGRGIASH